MTVLVLNGNYSIGAPIRRARTRPLAGNYQVLPPEPARILVKVDGALVVCPVQIRVGGVLADA